MKEIAGRDEATGRFLAGNSGNGGRKKGSRAKLSHDFIAALSDHFDEHGVDAIHRVWKDRPDTYLKVIGNVIPAKLETALTVTNVFAELNLTDPQEFAQAFRIARQMIGAEPPVIELTPEAEVAWRADD